MNKRQIILIVITLAAIAALVILILVKRPFSPASELAGPTFEPEFLNENEKAQFGLPVEASVQVLRRGEDGQVEVYKVIRQDSDLVSDPAAVQSERDPINQPR